jgi:hypothetical protein
MFMVFSFHPHYPRGMKMIPSGAKNLYMTETEEKRDSSLRRLRSE